MPDREAVSFNLTRDLLLQRMVDAMNGFSDYPIHFNGQVRQTGSHTGAPLSPSSAASQLCAAVRVLCWVVLRWAAQGYNIGTYDGTPQGPDYRQVSSRQLSPPPPSRQTLRSPCLLCLAL